MKTFIQAKWYAALVFTFLSTSLVAQSFKTIPAWNGFNTESELVFTPQQSFIEHGTYEVEISAAETSNYLSASTVVSLIIKPDCIGGVSTFPAPDTHKATPFSLCSPGQVSLTAKNCPGTLIWYNASTNQPIIGNQPVVSTTSSFYATCKIDNCETLPSKNVTVTIDTPLAESPGNVPVTWTGSVSSDWMNPCNWNPLWVPDSSNSVVIIPAVGRPPIIYLGQNSNLKKIIIEKYSRLANDGTLSIKSDADTLLNARGSIFNYGNLNITSQEQSTGISLVDSSVLYNLGNLAISTKGQAVKVEGMGRDITFYNYGGNVKIDNASGGFLMNSIRPSAVINIGGAIIYNGGGYAFQGENAGLENMGTIEVNSGDGIKLENIGVFLNAECGRILINEGEFVVSDTASNKGLIQLPDNYDLVNTGYFLNEGIVRAQSITGIENQRLTITNDCSGLSLVNPGGFTVNGIYSDSLLSTEVGTYNLTENDINLHQPLGKGIHRLYVHVLDDPSYCDYIVPFNYTVSVPDSISVSSTTICEGEELVLDAYCVAGTVTWYDSNESTIVLGIGRNFSFIPDAGSERSYYVSCELGDCSHERVVTPESVTIKSRPPAPTLVSNFSKSCTFNPIQIQPEGCSGEALWSDSTISEILLLNQVGTYSVSARCIEDGCLSEVSEILGDLKISLVDMQEVDDFSICEGSDLTLTGTCPGDNELVWFSDEAGLHEVSPVLHNITSAVRYYAACRLTDVVGCQSSLLPVNVFVEEPLVFDMDPYFPVNVYGCDGGTAEIIVDTHLISGQPYEIHWQRLIGLVFEDIEENTVYQNVNGDTLFVSDLHLDDDGSLFRVEISNSCNTVYSNTFTLKINRLPVIITQPVGQTVCVGNQTTLSVEADGSGLSYQWQVDDRNGFVNTSTSDGYYSIVNTPNLIISNITAHFNNYAYRCVIFNTCQSVNSEVAVLTVDPTINILSQPINRTVCTVSFTVNAVNIQDNTNISYQWQRSTNGGLTYTNVSSSSLFNGVNTKTLTLTGLTAGMNNSRYRCVINGYCKSTGAVLTVTPIATVTQQPKSMEICEGNNTSFSIVAYGVGLSYRWQVNSGSGFFNINDGDIYQGATESTLSLFTPSVENNNYQYRCLVWGNSNCDVVADTSQVANLSIGVPAEAYAVE